jgi:hypothetical protein
MDCVPWGSPDLLEVINSTQVIHVSHHAETMDSSLLTRGSKETQEDSKKKMQLLTSSPTTVLDRKERGPKLRITTMPTLSVRFKLCGYIAKSLCRLVFLICYVSLTPVLVHSYTNSCGN